MGEVYRARHLHLDEIRIIKVTKPDAAGEGLEPRRFQDEARLATLVRHPNVAALYDFSRLPDGSYYMVWEFIDGITLEEWLRRNGPLPAARALEVARQILAGLAEIHAQGIVHRDLSPDNIMLRERADGRPAAPRSSISASRSASPPSPLADDGHRALPREAQVLLARAGRRAARAARRSTRGATSTRSASSSTRCSRESRRSSRRRRRRISASTSTRRRLRSTRRRLPAAVGAAARGDHQAGAREEPRPPFPKRRGIPARARGDRAGGPGDRRDGLRSAAPEPRDRPVCGVRRPHSARRHARDLRRDPRDQALAGRGGRRAHAPFRDADRKRSRPSPLRRRRRAARRRGHVAAGGSRTLPRLEPQRG